jgi:hypothetical protein
MASVNQLANEVSSAAFDMFQDDNDDKENDLLVKSTLEAERSLSEQEEEKWESMRSRGPVMGASSRCSGGEKEIEDNEDTPAKLAVSLMRELLPQFRWQCGFEM